MDRGDWTSMWIFNTYTMGVMAMMLTCQLLSWFWFRCRFLPKLNHKMHASGKVASTPAIVEPGISDLISDCDLKLLLDDLDEKIDEDKKWVNVIDKKSSRFSYTAKYCRPKDEPLKYLSITRFENCSSELLRDFYLDNKYRISWDKTLLQYEQLQVDGNHGTEIGRMVKKFGFLTPREYILAWRVWEDKDGAFYCLSKGCEHPLVPRQRKYVRATFFRSGWRLRKVTGRNACEIKVVHQEDAGLNEDLAKLAFAKGIWSYISRTDDALRRYSVQPNSPFTVTIQKFPPGLNPIEVDRPETSTTRHQVADGSRMISKRPSTKLVKNGLIILGGVICLSRGNPSLGAKAVMAYILTKISKHGTSSRKTRAA